MIRSFWLQIDYIFIFFDGCRNTFFRQRPRQPVLAGVRHENTKNRSWILWESGNNSSLTDWEEGERGRKAQIMIFWNDPVKKTSKLAENVIFAWQAVCLLHPELSVSTIWNCTKDNEFNLFCSKEAKMDKTLREFQLRSKILDLSAPWPCGQVKITAVCALIFNPFGRVA